MLTLLASIIPALFGDGTETGLEMPKRSKPNMAFDGSEYASPLTLYDEIADWSRSGRFSWLIPPSHLVKVRLPASRLWLSRTSTRLSGSTVSILSMVCLVLWRRLELLERLSCLSDMNWWHQDAYGLRFSWWLG